MPQEAAHEILGNKKPALKRWFLKRLPRLGKGNNRWFLLNSFSKFSQWVIREGWHGGGVA
jgi:hypothetical protein